MSPTLPALPAVIAPRFGRTFQGIFRLAFRRFWLTSHVLFLLIAGVVIGFLGYNFANPHRHGSYAAWVVNFYLTFLVPLVTMIQAAGAIRDDFKSGTVDYVLTRPVRRPVFIVCHYLANLVFMQIDFLLFAIVVLGAGLVHGVSGLDSIALPVLGGQILLVAAFSGLGLVCGVFTSRPVLVGLGYGLLVEIGVGRIPTQLSKLSMTQQVREMLQPAVPTLSVGASAHPALTIALLLAYSAITVALAAAWFSRREFAGSGDA